MLPPGGDTHIITERHVGPQGRRPKRRLRLWFGKHEEFSLSCSSRITAESCTQAPITLTSPGAGLWLIEFRSDRVEKHQWMIA